MGLPIKEGHLRAAVGSILWGISSLLTAGLFLALAGDSPFSQGIMIALAVGLEGAKILTWKMGGWFRLLSGSLILLSVCASFGASLQTVQHAQDKALQASQQSIQHGEAYQARLRELGSLDRQIEALVGKLEVLPAEYTTAARKLSAEIQALRSTRSNLESQLDASTHDSPNRIADSSMFTLVSKVSGIDEDLIKFTLLMFLALNLEVAALVLAGHSQSIPIKSIPQSIPTPVGRNPIVIPSRPEGTVTAVDFLIFASTGTDLPLLHGRETTGKALGINSYTAKKLLWQLQDAGIIRPQGKRLFLCTDTVDEAIRQLTVKA